jgi:hypothetical protein
LVLSTLIGLVLVVIVGVWSLKRQLRCLETDLKGLVPDEMYHVMISPGARARREWRVLRHEGVRSWWRVRRMHYLCAELAFKHMQARLRPDETDIIKEEKRLKRRLDRLAPRYPDV